MNAQTLQLNQVVVEANLIILNFNDTIYYLVLQNLKYLFPYTVRHLH